MQGVAGVAHGVALSLMVALPAVEAECGPPTDLNDRWAVAALASEPKKVG